MIAKIDALRMEVSIYKGNRIGDIEKIQTKKKPTIDQKLAATHITELTKHMSSLTNKFA